MKTGFIQIGNFGYRYQEYQDSITITSIICSLDYGDPYKEQKLAVLSIPESIEDKPVVKCTGRVGSQYIRRLELPDTLKILGPNTFCECPKLQSITWSNNLMSIGREAFARCYQLNFDKLPDSLKKIGGAAFSNCCSLTSVTFPTKLKSIGHMAFFGCFNLDISNFDVLSKCEIPADSFVGTKYSPNYITLDDKIRILEQYRTDYLNSSTRAQKEKFGWTEDVYDLSSYLSLQSYGNFEVVQYGYDIVDNFYVSSPLSAILSKDAVYKFNDPLSRRFYYRYIGNEETVVVPDVIEGIDAPITTLLPLTFFNCPSVKKIIIPNSIAIEHCTFVNCPNLEEIIISESPLYTKSDKKETVNPTQWYRNQTLKTICSLSCFDNCPKLSKITLHESTITISDLHTINTHYTCVNDPSSQFLTHPQIYVNGVAIDAVTGEFRKE